MKYKVIRIGNSQGIRLGMRTHGNLIGKEIEIDVITNNKCNNNNVITNEKVITKEEDNKTNVITTTQEIDPWLTHKVK